jgi:hypothetical protein
VNEDIATVRSSGRFERECAELQDSRDPLDERWSRFMDLLDLKLDRGRRPFQTLKKMVCLRNVLVHRAARFRRVHEFPDPVIEKLESTGEFAFASDPKGGNLTWCQRVLNPACARWAFNAALDTFTEHMKLRGVSTFHPPFIDLPRIP